MWGILLQVPVLSSKLKYSKDTVHEARTQTTKAQPGVKHTGLRHEKRRLKPSVKHRMTV